MQDIGIEAVQAALAGIAESVTLAAGRREYSHVSKTYRRAPRPDGLRTGSKSALLVDLVTQPRGASSPELAKAIGSKKPLPLLHYACRRARLRLRFERSSIPGVPGRYFVE
jgi:hypothetical protein